MISSQLFIDNIWDADLADMQLTSNLIKKLVFDYVLLIFSANTHELFIPLKDKKILQLLTLVKYFKRI